MGTIYGSVWVFGKPISEEILQQYNEGYTKPMFELTNNKIKEVEECFENVTDELMEKIKTISVKNELHSLFTWWDDDYNWLSYILIFPTGKKYELKMPYFDDAVSKSEEDFLTFFGLKEVFSDTIQGLCQKEVKNDYPKK
jgi:hypothetical protein